MRVARLACDGDVLREGLRRGCGSWLGTAVGTRVVVGFLALALGRARVGAVQNHNRAAVAIACRRRLTLRILTVILGIVVCLGLA